MRRDVRGHRMRGEVPLQQRLCQRCQARPTCGSGRWNGTVADYADLKENQAAGGINAVTPGQELGGIVDATAIARGIDAEICKEAVEARDRGVHHRFEAFLARTLDGAMEGRRNDARVAERYAADAPSLPYASEHRLGHSLVEFETIAARQIPAAQRLGRRVETSDPQFGEGVGNERQDDVRALDLEPRLRGCVRDGAYSDSYDGEATRLHVPEEPPWPGGTRPKMKSAATFQSLSPPPWYRAHSSRTASFNGAELPLSASSTAACCSGVSPASLIEMIALSPPLFSKSYSASTQTSRNRYSTSSGLPGRLADNFFAGVFFDGAFFAGDFFAADFFAEAFFADVFFADVFFADVFFAGTIMPNLSSGKVSERRTRLRYAETEFSPFALV